MAIDDFGAWFEKAKVVSGKGREMEALKPLFKECWDNVEEFHGVREAEGKLADLRRMIDNIQDAIESARCELSDASDECDTCIKGIEGEED